MGNLNREEIGKVAYAAAGAYQVAELGAEPGPSWDDMDQEAKDQYLIGVDFYTENPEDGPKEMHNDWLGKKLDDGWQYGEELNEENKTSPWMVDYEELSAPDKVHDAIVHSVVRSMASIVVETKTVVTVQKSGKAGMVGVKYIGDRDVHVDNLYGTKLAWVTGQVHNVDQATASKMAQHTDVYELVDSEEQVDAPEQSADNQRQQQERDQAEQVLPNLETMNKDQLVVFAQQRFNMNLPRTMKEDTMRQRIFGLIQSGK